MKYFQRVKWQYMILDEAQAIKSSSRYSVHVCTVHMYMYMYMHVHVHVPVPSLENKTTPFYSTGCITSPACRYIQGCRREWSGSQNYICIHKHVHVP